MKEKKVVIRGENITLRQSNITLVTPLAGITHGDCQFVIKKIVNVGDILDLLPDIENKHDDTAIGLFKFKNGKAIGFVGWIPNNQHTFQQKTRIFKGLCADEPWKAIVKEIMQPSVDFNFYNVLVEISQQEK